jgi:hypothetical protein
MTQNSNYRDYTGILFSVTLSTGETIPGVNCALLRVEGNDSRKAEALIYCYVINSQTKDGIIIKPTSYISFQNADGDEWKILDFKENPTTDPPGFIFRLLASS